MANSDGSVAGIDGGHMLKFSDIGDPAVDKLREAAAVQSSSWSSSSSSSSAAASVAAALAAAANPPPLPPAAAIPTCEDGLEPFAVVDSVVAHSPASESGLKAGDLILKYGTANASNHGNLQALGEVTMAAFHRGGSLPATVKRKSAHLGGEAIKLTLHISPKEWEGKGVLGVHIVPYVARDHSF